MAKGELGSHLPLHAAWGYLLLLEYVAQRRNMSASHIARADKGREKRCSGAQRVLRSKQPCSILSAHVHLYCLFQCLHRTLPVRPCAPGAST